MQDLKVALIQTTQFWEDKPANFSFYETEFLQQLNPGDADLILFPEMFNTSFSMNTVELAETMQGESIKWLIKWATKLDTPIGASLIIHENGNYFNRFVLATSTGVETFYDKRHLFRMAHENESFTAGKNRVIVPFKGWNLMLQICYDLRFPVFSRNKTINGSTEYDALIYIANWPEKRAYVWKNLLQARAIENQAYSIGVNRVGKDGNGISYSGDSMVVDPWGNIIHQSNENQTVLSIITLQKNCIADIRRTFPAFLDAD